MTEGYPGARGLTQTVGRDDVRTESPALDGCRDVGRGVGDTRRRDDVPLFCQGVPRRYVSEYSSAFVWRLVVTAALGKTMCALM